MSGAALNTNESYRYISLPINRYIYERTLVYFMEATFPRSVRGVDWQIQVSFMDTWH